MCIFCDFANKTKKNDYIVFEDSKSLAFFDINPVRKGHTLLIPKKHYPYIFDMPDELYFHLFKKAKEIAFALKKATDCERVGIMVEGFMVNHVHIHLIPLFGGEIQTIHESYINDREKKEILEKIKSLLKDKP